MRLTSAGVWHGHLGAVGEACEEHEDIAFLKFHNLIKGRFMQAGLKMVTSLLILLLADSLLNI